MHARHREPVAPKKSMWRVAHFDTLRLIARFTARSQASNSVRRQNLSRQMRTSLFQSGSSILLKAKMPPALIQASKSFRWKRRPLPTFTLAGAVRSLT
jgi:hypothetical protein